MRADLQQYYGLNVDGMGAEYTCSHAAALVAMLPPQSRLMVQRNGALAWDDATYLLSHIDHDLRVLAWQQTEDARHKRNYPKHIETPADRERDRRAEESSTPEFKRYVADKLGIPEDRR